MGSLKTRVCWNLSKVCRWQPVLNCWVITDAPQLCRSFMEDDAHEDELNERKLKEMISAYRLPIPLLDENLFSLDAVPAILAQTGVVIGEAVWADMIFDAIRYLHEVFPAPDVLVASSSEPSAGAELAGAIVHPMHDPERQRSSSALLWSAVDALRANDAQITSLEKSCGLSSADGKGQTPRTNW